MQENPPIIRVEELTAKYGGNLVFDRETGEFTTGQDGPRQEPKQQQQS